MAIYHLSVKCLSRSHGRSATAAAAYRSAVKIKDERTGETFDYARKSGVSHTELVLPSGAPEWARDREQLWNRAEAAEKRTDSTVAREFEVALPDELNAQGRRALALELARHIVDRHGCAVDMAIHEPGKEGDLRNFHAHLLCTTRRLKPEGFTEKTRELDERKSGEVDKWRERWATLTNEHLKAAGLDITVDHRSLAAQGIERTPTKHLGPVVAERLRRGKDSYVAERIREERIADAQERILEAAERGRLEREGRALTRSIIDTESTLKTALAIRATTRERAATPEALRQESQQRWLESRRTLITPDNKPDPTPDRNLILDSGRDR